MNKNVIENTWFKDQIEINDIKNLAKLTTKAYKNIHEKQKDIEKSHNVYSENQQNTLIKLPTYLIFNENVKQIIPCQNITTAISIATKEGCICSLFERAGSMGKYYTHVCDVSKDVL